jgi:nucleoid DNA-binding protein
MSQEELISMISEQAGISRETVRSIVRAFGDIWSEELVTAGELQLDTVGDFFIDHRAGRRGVNTETREIFIIPPSDFVSFIPSSELFYWSNKLP